jgi:epoxyqueuosine reductase
MDSANMQSFHTQTFLTRAAGDARWIAARASALGFDACGVVRADRFPELDRLTEWLQRGYGGEMRYLQDPRRADVREVMPEVRSVIVCALNYNTAFPLSVQRGSQSPGNHGCRGIARTDDSPRGWISRYAWGDDYHEVLWSLLNRFATDLRARFGEGITARAYADTGPISERILAKHAGLGWIGKNTLLLNQKLGSWFFLGAILTSLDLEPSLANADAPPPDLCGSCRKCVDACPTQAIVEPYVLDARRCISYLTIELRGPISEEHREAIGTHVFGCDICQDVCPWNRKAPITTRPEFLPRAAETAAGASESLSEPSLEWLAGLSDNEFRAVFRGSAVKRAKWRGLMRNACIALGNAVAARGEVSERVCALLARYARNEDSVIAESAQWALSRIQEVEGKRRIQPRAPVPAS